MTIDALDYVYVAGKVFHPTGAPTLAVHRTCFHGIWIGPYYAHPVSEDDRETIIRSGVTVPEITSPSIDLVVSQKLKDRVKEEFRLEFEPVRFSKLVNFWTEKGDFSFYDDYPGLDPGDLFRKLPDQPEMHRELDPYYKLRCPLTKDLATVAPTHQLKIPADNQRVDEDIVVAVSLPEMEEISAFHDWGTWLKRPLFEQFAEYLDPDFFVIREPIVAELNH